MEKYSAEMLHVVFVAHLLVYKRSADVYACAMIRKLRILIPISILLIPLVLRQLMPDVLHNAQLKVFDLFMTAYPRDYHDSPVRIVDIDDASLAKLGQWPWPRSIIAQTVDKLREAGATSIGFDVVFAEADRSSPSKMVDALGDAAQNLDPVALALLPDYDEMLKESLAKGKVVTGFVLTDDAPKTTTPAQKYGVVMSGYDPTSYAMQLKSSVTNLPLLEDAAAGNGSFNVRPDSDGVIRRAPLMLALGGNLYPSLSVEMLRVANNATTYAIKGEDAGEGDAGKSLGFTMIKVANHIIPVNSDGSIWLHMTPYHPERYIPLWKVLEKDFDVSQVKGKMVLIGTSAPGLKDIRATALNPVINGVEVHAQALEQILAQDYIARPSWLPDAELTAMLVAGLLILFVLPRVSALAGAMLTTALIAAAGVGSVYAFTTLGWLVDPVIPCFAILIVYGLESFHRHMAAEKEKQQVRHAFSHYMSPALVEKLAANPEALTLGGEMRDMSIMFCDIRGFTTISEQFDAQGLTSFINRFLTPMTEVILSTNGTIDKYIGDCIMAFWNAPLDDAAHGVHACEAALGMLKELDTLNAKLKVEAEKENKPYIPVHIGIGINSGECCVGNMGSKQRFDYSVLGDDVNLASRLEGQSKYYGVPVVIGQKTAAHAPEMAILEIDTVQVKGKTEAVRIFALLGGKELAQSKGFLAFKDAFNAMMSDYHVQDWNNAALNLQDADVKARLALEDATPQGLFDLYRERIDHYRSLPSNSTWSGVHVAQTK